MAEFDMHPPQAPGWDDEELEAPPEPVSPELLARRRQLRSWVGRGMVALAIFTVGGALVRVLAQRAPEPAAEIAAAATPLNTAVVAPVIPGALDTAAPTSLQPVTAVPPTAVVAESLRDVTLPPLVDSASLERWSHLARAATAEEFKEVDARLAKQVKGRASATQQRSRLARAILWREQGRAADVRPVFEDLALHAKSADLREAARAFAGR